MKHVYTTSILTLSKNLLTDLPNFCYKRKPTYDPNFSNNKLSYPPGQQAYAYWSHYFFLYGPLDHKDGIGGSR